MGMLAFEAQSYEQDVNGGQSMSKITFLGAGSTVFAKNVLGDCMLTPALQGCELALFDIDPVRLKDPENILSNLKICLLYI